MKKLVGILVVGLLFVTLIAQGSVAYFHEETSFSNRISAGNLGIDLIEASDDENAVFKEHGYEFSQTMPGAKLDRRVWVENTKDKTLYVRVRVKRAWYNAQNEKQVDLDASLISIITEDTSNWIILDDGANSNQEELYFYYKKPLAKGEATDHIMDSFEISNQISNGEYQDVHAEIMFEADAIQENAAADAILNEWGMDVEIAADGTITEILE